jgi:hypothetical protein
VAGICIFGGDSQFKSDDKSDAMGFARRDPAAQERYTRKPRKCETRAPPRK